MNPKLTVLIIEDEKSIRSFIETTLNANDYRVLTAGSGQEGLSSAASNCPDVILLDLGLPDMDGPGSNPSDPQLVGSSYHCHFCPYSGERKGGCPGCRSR